MLSASSQHFAQLLRLTPSGQTPILILDGPSANDVHALINFIYHGEVNIDQEALPSLLRTASSFQIKGLTDITFSNDILASGNSTSPLCESFPPSISVETLASFSSEQTVHMEDATPLNLTCNKNILNDNKIPEKRTCVEETFCNDESNFNRPSKKIRIIESNSYQQPSTIALITPNRTNGAILAPCVSTKSLNQISSKNPVVQAINIVHAPKENIQHATIRNKVYASEIKSDPYRNSSPTFVSLSSKSFPILKMALSSSSQSYQPSSTTSPSCLIESSNHYQDNAVSLQTSKKSSEADGSQSQILNFGTRSFPSNDSLNATTDYALKPAIIVSAQQEQIECKIKSREDRENLVSQLKCTDNKSEIMVTESKYIDNETKTLDIESKCIDNDHQEETVASGATFMHKKFSTCTIPQFIEPTKAVQIADAVSSNDRHRSDEPKFASFSSELLCNPTSMSRSSKDKPSIPSAFGNQNIVKLTPVSITGYVTTKCSPSQNSFVYSNSIDSQPSNVAVISSSSPTSSDRLPVFPALEKTKEQASPYLQSLFKQAGSTETSASNSPITQHVSPPTTTINTLQANDEESTAATPTAQRVMINMRTFKVCILSRK